MRARPWGQRDDGEELRLEQGVWEGLGLGLQLRGQSLAVGRFRGEVLRMSGGFILRDGAGVRLSTSQSPGGVSAVIGEGLGGGSRAGAGAHL